MTRAVISDSNQRFFPHLTRRVEIMHVIFMLIFIPVRVCELQSSRITKIRQIPYSRAVRANCVLVEVIIMLS